MDFYRFEDLNGGMATPRDVVVPGLPALLLHGDGLNSGAPLHEGMGSGGGAHGDGLLAVVALPLNLSGMVLHVILHDFLLLGGDLRAVHPPGGLLVRPPLSRLLHGSQAGCLGGCEDGISQAIMPSDPLALVGI